MKLFTNTSSKKYAVVLAAAMTVGCLKAYDTPEYQDVDTAETAFLVPLEGDTASQAKFQSVKYLEDRKVATKRVQITHRWSQTGRWNNDGQWIPTVRLIKVNRSPVTREWTNEGQTGTSNKDQAIHVESQDSVGFGMGFTVTALVTEDDAATFLYWYPSGSLAAVMDGEVRARVQKVAESVCAEYPLDNLRSRKQEIVDSIEKDLTNFYKTRGVTITAVGIVGGMAYENPDIQKAIDKTFVAQQEKVVNEARLEAQKRENERVELEAKATAERSRLEAQGQADAKTLLYQAEIDNMKKLNEAVAGANASVIQLKVLEIEKERVSRWNGQYPMYFMGGGTTPNLMVSIPTPGMPVTGSAVMAQPAAVK